MSTPHASYDVNTHRNERGVLMMNGGGGGGGAVYFGGFAAGTPTYMRASQGVLLNFGGGANSIGGGGGNPSSTFVANPAYDGDRTILIIGSPARVLAKDTVSPRQSSLEAQVNGILSCASGIPMTGFSRKGTTTGGF